MTISGGSKLPPAPPSLTEKTADQTIVFPSEGKFLVIGVPGAYTSPCSKHVPTFIKTYDALLKKGIKDIFVVAVNDIFVVNAWRDHLLSEHAPERKSEDYAHLHLAADRSAEFVKALGLQFDAAGLLGNVRSKRFALVVEDGVVIAVNVEEHPQNVTVTSADSLLAYL